MSTKTKREQEEMNLDAQAMESYSLEVEETSIWYN